MKIFDLEVGVSLDSKGVSASLRRLEKEGRQTDESLGRIGDGAEKSQKKATGAFGRIANSLRSLRKDAAKDVTIGVRANTSAVDRARQAVAGLRGEGKRDVEITVRADVADALSGLGRVDAAKRGASGEATIRVDAETASALSGLGLVERQASALDGREIDIKTDRSRSGLAGLSAAMSGMAGAAQRMDSGLSAGGVRIAMIGGIAATAAALFTPLLGALASVGSLGVAAGAGIGLIAAPLLMATSRLSNYADANAKLEELQKSGTATAEELADAQREVGVAAEGLPPALIGMYDAFQRFKTVGSQVFEPAQVAVSKLATRILNDVIPSFGILNRTSVASIGALGRAWDGFVSRLRMPEQQGSIGTLLGITPQIVFSLTKAVGDFGLALINIFATAAPSAVALGNAISGAASRTLAWSSSAGGMDAVRASIAAAVPVFQALGRMVMDVGGALFRFGSENAPAIATAIDMVSKALVWVVNGFSRLTQIFGPIVPIAAALTPVFLAVMLIFGQVASAVVALVSGLVSVGGAISAVAAAFGVGIVPLLGVVALAIAAVVAGVIVLRRNWDSIRTVLAPLIPVFEQVKAGLQNLATVMKGLFTGNTGTEQFRRAFAALPGPVRNAVKLIVVAWRGLKTAFSQAWTQIRPILSQIGSGLRTGLVTAFNFVLSQGKAFVSWFRSSWPQIHATVVPILTTIGNILRTVLVAAFRFAIQNGNILVNWFKTNWPLIRQTTLTVFNAVRAAITGAFQRAWMIIRPIIAMLVAFWRQNSTQILTIARTAWNTIKTVIQTAIRIVLGIIRATMQLINGNWRGAWNTIRQILSVAWNAIKQLVQNSITILKNIIQIGLNVLRGIFSTIWNAIKTVVMTVVAALVAGAVAKWNELKTQAQNIFERIRGEIESRIKAAKSAFISTVENLVSEGRSKLEAFRDNVGDIFNAVRDRIVNPVESAYEGVKSAFDRILGLVNGILERVGLDPIGSTASTPPRTTNSPRPTTGAFAKGGVVGVRRFARGGMGTEGRNPRVHLWNEQMGPEAYIVKNRPAKEQTPYLEEAAGWHGYDLSPKDEHGHDHSIPYTNAPKFSWAKHQAQQRRRFRSRKDADRAASHSPLPARTFKEGGIDVGALPANTSYPWQPLVGKAVSAFYEIGANDVTTYQGHSPSIDLATDVWVGGSSYGKTPGDGAKFQGFADWVVGNRGGLGAEYVISNQKINTGGGWSGMEDRGSITQNHYDHVHVSFIPGQGGGTVGGTLGEFFSPGGQGGGGGSISVPNPMQLLFEKLWKSTVKPVVDGVLGPLEDAKYVLAQAAGAAARKVPEGIYKWIDDKIPDTIGGTGTGGSATGNFSGSKQDMAKTFAQNAVGRGMPGRLPVMVSMQELGGYWFGGSDDYRSVTGYSTAADHDSLGFFQQRPSTGWGTPEQIMDPAYALGKFLDAAEGYKGQYENNATGLGAWGQAVQRSAFPDAYAKHWDAAAKVIGDPQLYSKGGMAIGPQLMALSEAGGKELVLPLDNAGVMRSAQAALGTSALREELAGMRRELAAIRSEGMRTHITGLDDSPAQKMAESARAQARSLVAGAEGRSIITNQVERAEQSARRRGAR